MSTLWVVEERPVKGRWHPTRHAVRLKATADTILQGLERHAVRFNPKMRYRVRKYVRENK